MLVPLREGANEVGSTITGVTITVPAVPAAGIAAERYVNGAPPSAPTIRETADYLNAILARRARVLFRKYVKTLYAEADAVDNATLSFACRTRAVARTIRIVTVGY